jgi:hypothetical protein
MSQSQEKNATCSCCTFLQHNCTFQKSATMCKLHFCLNYGFTFFGWLELHIFLNCGCIFLGWLRLTKILISWDLAKPILNITIMNTMIICHVGGRSIGSVKLLSSHRGFNSPTRCERFIFTIAKLLIYILDEALIFFGYIVSSRGTIWIFHFSPIFTRFRVHPSMINCLVPLAILQPFVQWVPINSLGYDEIKEQTTYK